MRRRLPAEREGITHKFKIGGAKGYVTANVFEDGTLGEVFVKMDAQGSTVSGFIDAWSVAVSILLQTGTPLETVVEKFRNSNFEPNGLTDSPHEQLRIVKSPIDYVVKWLAYRFLEPVEEEDDVTSPGIEIGDLDSGRHLVDVVGEVITRETTVLTREGQLTEGPGFVVEAFDDALRGLGFEVTSRPYDPSHKREFLLNELEKYDVGHNGTVGNLSYAECVRRYGVALKQLRQMDRELKLVGSDQEEALSAWSDLPAEEINACIQHDDPEELSDLEQVLQDHPLEDDDADSCAQCRKPGLTGASGKNGEKLYLQYVNGVPVWICGDCSRKELPYSSPDEVVARDAKRNWRVE